MYATRPYRSVQNTTTPDAMLTGSTHGASGFVPLVPLVPIDDEQFCVFFVIISFRVFVLLLYPSAFNVKAHTLAGHSDVLVDFSMPPLYALK
tara:strand:+ start:131 stop:406 length:276 start_codon:yes stop_codon:yes gene_type:complete